MSNRVVRDASFAVAAVAGLYAASWYAVRRYEHLDPETAGAPGTFIDFDGVRIHYVEAGHGDPVVLIHGLNASTFTYRYTIPELAQRHRVIALDLKGFGYSARPKRSDYSQTAQVELVRGLMDHLEIERAAVVGHSMGGGGVAMRLALRYPERVTRLVLVDSVTDHQVRRGLLRSRLLRPFLPIAAALIFQRRFFRKLAARSAVHDPAHVTPELIEAYVRTSRMRGHLRALGAMATHRERDEPLALQRITQPTLVVWGEHDRWIPIAHGKELARQIPHSRFVSIRSAGHLPLEEQPVLSNTALLEFIDGQPSSDPAVAGATPALEPAG